MHGPLIRRLLATVLAATGALATLPGTAQAVDLPRLLDDVEYWRARHRDDRVAQVWQQVLTDCPDDLEALFWLADHEEQAKNLDAARGLRQRIEPLLTQARRSIGTAGLAIDGPCGGEPRQQANAVRILTGRALADAAAGRRAQALRQIADLEQGAERIPVLLALVARAWSDLGEHDRAIALLDRAESLAPGPVPAIGLAKGVVLLRLNRLDKMAQVIDEFDPGVRLSAAEARELDDLRGALDQAVKARLEAARAATERAAAERAAAERKAQEQHTPDQASAEAIATTPRRSEELATAPFFRHRKGTPGLGRILAVVVPISGSIPMGKTFRVRLTVVPQYLSAGSLDLASWPGVQFGQTGTIRDSGDEGLVAQNRRGVGLSASLETEAGHFWLGTSPLGFPLTTMLGGASYRFGFGRFGLTLNAFRTSVTDSVLAASGAWDPLTGRVWGLVTDNGGRMDLGLGFKQGWAYVGGGYSVLMGRHVVTNGKGVAGAGFQIRVVGGSTWSARTGANVGMSAFEHNLKGYTWGHGGYYSPQFSYYAYLPLSFSGRFGPVEIDAQVDMGINGFWEDETPYYPGDRALQGAREQMLAWDGHPAQAIYPALTQVGFAANTSARLSYRPWSRIVCGLELETRYGKAYEEYLAGLFVSVGLRRDGAPPASTIPTPY